MSKRSTKNLDPTQYASSGASQFGGGFSYKLRYDPSYGAKFYSGLVILLVIVYLIFGGFTSTASYAVVGGGIFIALLIYFIYPSWKRYDLGSSVDYCTRLLGPKASKDSIRACTETRENVEGNSNVSNSILGGFILADIMR